MPGPIASAHRRCKGVHRDEERHHATQAETGKHRPNGLVVGIEDTGQALCAIELRERAVAGDLVPVAYGAERLGVVGRPVAIDDQTRVSGEHRGRAQRAGQPAGELRSADVPRHVLPGRELRQSEPCERAWKRPTRVIADQERRGDTMFVEDDVGRRVVGPEQRPAAGSCGGESGHGWQMNKRVWIVPRAGRGASLE